jgi:hypothetical protein
MQLIAGFIPFRGGGLFLLLVISQLVFFLKLSLKVLRYSSVTALMEQQTYRDLSHDGQQKISFSEPDVLNTDPKTDSNL